MRLLDDRVHAALAHRLAVVPARREEDERLDEDDADLGVGLALLRGGEELQLAGELVEDLRGRERERGNQLAVVEQLRKERGGRETHVDVELLVAAQGEEELDEQIDAALLGRPVVGRGYEARVPRLLERRVPESECRGQLLERGEEGERERGSERT